MGVYLTSSLPPTLGNRGNECYFFFHPSPLFFPLKFTVVKTGMRCLVISTNSPLIITAFPCNGNNPSHPSEPHVVGQVDTC